MAYPINKKLQMQKFASCDIGYCVILNKGMQLSLCLIQSHHNAL